MRLALHAPDIPQNTGTMLRLGACMGVACDLIGPAGFDVSDRTIRRAGLDYLEHVDITRHLSWQASPAARRAEGGRIVRLTTRAGEELWRLAFAAAMALGGGDAADGALGSRAGADGCGQAARLV
jgi:tRNA (cytidine/uridine-2'-O-)-methyltransferase